MSEKQKCKICNGNIELISAKTPHHAEKRCNKCKKFYGFLKLEKRKIPIKRTTYTINNKTYKSKKEVLQQTQKILNTYKINETIKGEDHKFLLEFIKYHPNYQEKKGIGIKEFKIQKTIYNNKGFIIIRNDETTTDFSYLKTLNNQSLISEIKKACRTTIRPQIKEFKKEYFNKEGEKICPYTKIKLTWENSHVDHEKPEFNEIFDEWYKNKKISIEDINPTKDNDQETYFINKVLEKDFYEFHKNKANLRVISIEGNLKLKKKEVLNGESNRGLQQVD